MDSSPHICDFSHHIRAAIIKGITTTKATGSTKYISPLLLYRFWIPVYYKVDDSDFPSHITEKCGHWVGIAEHVVHDMTLKVLNDDTKNTLFCSNLRSAEELMEFNPQLDPLCGEPYPFLKSCPDRDKQSVTRLDYSPRKDEQDKNFPWMKTKPMEKLGRIMQQKCLS